MIDEKEGGGGRGPWLSYNAREVVEVGRGECKAKEGEGNYTCSRRAS